MKTIAALLLMTSVAGAQTKMVECSYDLPKSGHRVFVQSETEATKWLKTMSADHSIPGWSANESCVPLDDIESIYHLFVQTRNGQVSLQHGLTRQACEHVLQRLRPDYSGCENGCMRSASPSDFERGECFK